MAKRMSSQAARDVWVHSVLAQRPKGGSLLDVGAGECIYKKAAEHLEYVSQDAAQYDGQGNREGLQTGSWDFSRIDIVCDVLDIPEDRQFDTVLCTEVLEHVPDPAATVRKLCRLVKPGGLVVITAPFMSITHFAPYHFATGFNRYFYEHHFRVAGFEIKQLEPNGNFFDHASLGPKQARRVFQETFGRQPPIIGFVLSRLAWLSLRGWAKRDKDNASAASACLGWNVVAARPSDGSP